MANYYEILGISENATQPKIRSAYKELAIKYHPDKNGGDKAAEEKFKIINNIYQTLSDPYKKSRYDYELKYKQFRNSQVYTNSGHYQTTYQSKNKCRANKQTHTAVRERETKSNLVISLTVLGIMTTIISLSMLIENYYHTKKLEATLNKKNELMNTVQTYYQSHDYKTALGTLNYITAEYPEFYIFTQFKLALINELSMQAELRFSQADYAQALEYFTILNDFSQTRKASYDYAIVDCYIALRHYDEALISIEKFIAKDPTDIRACFQKADVLSFDSKKLDESLRYYDKAVDLAIEYYIKKYGNAFIILVQPAKMPDIHYDVFMGRAQLHFTLGNYERSLEDCGWAAYLKPKQSTPFLCKADNHYAMGNKKSACENCQHALALGSKAARKKLLDYCI